MTIEQIEKEVRYIREAAHDDQLAHSLEDALWTNVLEAIANGAPNPGELARAALVTKLITFSRWCA